MPTPPGAQDTFCKPRWHHRPGARARRAAGSGGRPQGRQVAQVHEWHPGVGLPDLLSPSVQTTPVAVKAGAGPQEDPDPSSEWPVSRPISGTNVTTPLGLGLFVFFFNDTATTEIYTGEDTLSLHDALPISELGSGSSCGPAPALTATGVVWTEGLSKSGSPTPGCHSCT